MRKTILALTATAIFSSTVMAEGISTGAKGLTYNDVFGANLSSALFEQGFDLPLKHSKGSIENLDRVASGEADLGFTQADALMGWKTKNPNLQNNVEILGSLGKECAFMAVKKGGRIDSEDDLGQEGVKIATGSVDAGSSASWSYMTQLEESYQKASVFNRGGMRALAGVSTGKYDGFMWVTAEGNMDNRYLKTVLADASGLELLPLDDHNMNDKLPNGESVYTFKKVTVQEGFLSNTTVTAPCTDVLVVGNVDTDEELLDSVASILLTNKARIMNASN